MRYAEGGSHHPLRAVLRDQLTVRLGQLLVGDHHVELFQGGEMRGAHYVELAVVGQQHAVLGLAQDLLLDRHFIEVEAGHAEGFAHACGRDECPGQAHGVEDAALVGMVEHLVLAMEGAATQDDRAVGFLLQLEQHVERVADRRELQFIGDEINHKGHRGTAVEKYRVATLDNRSRELADAAFLFHVPSALLRDFVVGRSFRVECERDMPAEQMELVRVTVEIPSQGHFRDFQQRGHLPQMDRLLVLQGLLDQFDAF